MKTIIFTLLILAILNAKIPDEKVGLSEYREDALEVLSYMFQHEGNVIGTRLPQIIQTTYIKDAFSKKPSGLEELQCEKILKKTDFQETNLIDKYYLSVLASNYCSELKENNKILSFQQDFEQALQSDNLLQIYYGFLGLVNFNQEKLHDELLVATCEKLGGYLQPDGTTKREKKSHNSSYFDSAHIFEIYDVCLNLQDSHSYLNKLTQQIKVPLMSVFLNSFDIQNGQIAILENQVNSLETTIRLVNFAKRILGGKFTKYLGEVEGQFRKDYEVGIVGFLKSIEDGVLSFREKYELIRFYNSNNTPYLFVRQLPVLGSKRYTEIQFRWENLLGQVQKDQDKLNSYLDISLKNRKGSVVEKNLQIEANEKNENWTYKIKVETKNVAANLGYYTLQFINRKQTEFQWHRTERVFFVTKVRCDDLQFEVTEDGNSPSEYSNRLKENEKIPMPYDVSGDKNWVHFKFRLDFDRDVKIVPKQVGIVLIHPKDGRIGKIVQARFDEINDLYRVKINLADSKHLLPYQHLYEAKMIISDQRLRENVEWQFAKFQIKYKSPRMEGIPTGLEYEQLPEIQHTFKEPHQQANIAIVLFFCTLVLAAFLAFMAVLGSLGVNSDLMPKASTGKIANVLFVLFIGFILAVLVAFWIEINLQQLVAVALVILVPFYLLGRYALSFIPDSDRE